MALPAPLAPVLAVAVVSMLSFGALRFYAWRAAKEPPKTAMGRIRLSLGLGLPLTGLVTLFAAVLAGALDSTDAALTAVSPALADSPVGAVLTWLPAFAGVTVAV